MSKKIRLFLALIVMISLAGCASNGDEDNIQNTDMPVDTETNGQETAKPSSKPSVEPVETSDSEINQTNYRTINVKGLFDVQVMDPLPSQMEVEIVSKDDLTRGAIAFNIVSSNPNCTPDNECMFVPYSLDWYTKDALEQYKETAEVPINEDDFITELETSLGTIYIYKHYAPDLISYIADGSYPDYAKEDVSLVYPIEDLVRFD